MKFKKLLIILMILLIIFAIFPTNIFSISHGSDIETHNIEILEKVRILQNLAEEYIEQNTTTSYTSTDLCMQYIRKDRYNNALWESLLDSVDTEFITYLENKENVPHFQHEILFDPNTGKEIDFVHMIATLNTYLQHGDTVMSVISTDYAGWAGDLITLLEEVTIYRTENNINNKDELQEYSNSLLGTNKASTFPCSDILADLDALTLYKDSNNRITEDLYTALCKYYISIDSTYNVGNRLLCAQTILGNTQSTVKEKAIFLLTDTTFGSIDLKKVFFENSDIVSQITTDDIDVVSHSFANYVYEIPYLKLQESNGIGTVGQSVIDVKIIESNANLTNDNIEIENNQIAKAEIYGEYLRITPLDGGQTIITVYSADKTTSSTYELTSKNIAPNITRNLDETYELTLNVEKIISLEAEGTNNIYTWYIQNPTDGTFNKVAETYENTYKLFPTLEMNNTYIRCGIKNNGNDEIFSNDAKLVVYDNQNDVSIDENTDNKPSDTYPDVLPETGQKNGLSLLISSILILSILNHQKYLKNKMMEKIKKDN